MYITLVSVLCFWGAQMLFLLGIARPVCCCPQAKNFILSIQYVKICRDLKRGGWRRDSNEKLDLLTFPSFSLEYCEIPQGRRCMYEWQWVFVVLYMSTEYGLKYLKIALGWWKWDMLFKQASVNLSKIMSRSLNIFPLILNRKGFISSSSVLLWNFQTFTIHGTETLSL